MRSNGQAFKWDFGSWKLLTPALHGRDEEPVKGSTTMREAQPLK
jgi:hypothetical protein